MSRSEVLSVDLLRVDGDTQARVAVNQDVVNEYAELVSAGKFWPFESITVFHDGTDYWIADGFHRTLAAKQAGRSSVPCNVITGTARDARIYGMRANDEHGLRMSREDRRKNVIWLLEAYPEMTQKDVAEKAGVAERTVRNVISDQENENRQIAGSASKPRKTRGKTSKKASKKSTSAEEKEAEKAKKLAEREAEKARKAAEKEAEKVRKAAEKEAEKAAKAKAAAEAKAAKEAERVAARVAAEKAKEAAKAAKKLAREQAREKAKADKLAALPANEQASAIKSLINQHLGHMVRLLDNLNHVRPNRSALDSNLKALKGIKLW